ncbi:MAG: aminopeptidase P family protein [Elusimicrobia bacterium]|nr:aminopeptidase P family protein [Elusimicrobiota bacterium]
MNFKKRIKNVSKNIRNVAYLVTNRADIFYLTGVDLDGFYLLVKGQKIFAFCSLLLKAQLESLLKGIEIISGENLLSLITNFLKKKKIRILGLNPKFISHSLYLELKKNFKIKLLDPISSLRQIKDREEIEYIKKSCKIALKTLKIIKKMVRPGVSEEQIAFKIEEYFSKSKAKPAFPPIVAFGVNTAKPHHIPTSKKARKNDIITIDLGSIYKGYCSDLTRTFFLGKIPTPVKKVYHLIKEAQSRAIYYINKARKVGEIDKAARDIISQNGYGKYFVHSTGHGLGIEVHEAPKVNKENNYPIRQGMVLTVEPGIYISGKFGVRIEDTVLVTKKGFEILTK